MQFGWCVCRCCRPWRCSWALLRSISKQTGRVCALPSDRRAKLIENINKFDLVYTSEQQASLRELDRRINELPPQTRAEYLGVLSRYHHWLSQLPDAKQDELSTLAAGDRMAAVKKLIKDDPLSRPLTARFIRRADVGAYSPLELAELYMIWQAVPKARRREIERISPIARRHEALYTLAKERDIPHEVSLSDFNEAATTKRFEEFARAGRQTLLLNDLRKKQGVAGRGGSRDLAPASDQLLFQRTPAQACDFRAAHRVPGGASALAAIGLGRACAGRCAAAADGGLPAGLSAPDGGHASTEAGGRHRRCGRKRARTNPHTRETTAGAARQRSFVSPGVARGSQRGRHPLDAGCAGGGRTGPRPRRAQPHGRRRRGQ